MTATRTPAANRFQPIDPQPDALPMPNQTDKTLAQIRTELLTTFSAADWESYSHLVGWLRDIDVASHGLKLGDVAPDRIRRYDRIKRSSLRFRCLVWARTAPICRP